MPSGQKKREHKLRRRKIGAIAIILCAVLPILLLLFRYGLDLMSYYKAKIYGSGNVGVRSLAHEAALEVAKKWNPGLTLNQQKISLLRIADDIYNTSAIYRKAPVHAAIPGLELYTVRPVAGGLFDPLRLIWSNAVFEDETPVSGSAIPYEVKTTTHKRLVFTFGGAQAFYRIMYGTAKDPKFLLKRKQGDWVSEDMFWDYIPGVGYGYRAAALTARTTVFDNGVYNTAWGGDYEATEDATYTVRAQNFTNDTRVQIEVVSDQIKVQIDSTDVAFAVPAECNVDIVLAVPINGAATNANNCDSTTPTTGASSITDLPRDDQSYATTISSATLEADEFVSESIRATPIYQIAQGLKTFLRNNFEFTRGVNVGLIPYSGKLSLPPDRNYAWTADIPAFDANEFLENKKAYLRGCFLYGVNGAEAGVSLIPPTTPSENPYVKDTFQPQTSDLSIPVSDTRYSYVALWGALNEQTTYKNSSGTDMRNEGPGTGIMCRCGYVDEVASDYIGDPLSTEDPTSASTPKKWRRVNIHPGYLGYANLLSMKTDKGMLYPHPCYGTDGALQGHPQNPYFLIELQSDVGKICDLLSVMGPFSERAASNFLFIPISWAHNLFCDWTNNPGCVAVNTGATGDATGGRLSRQTKSTAGRKKALILIVNKPDWFEPHELTYLGFDNDYAEVPMVESDKIDFGVNFLDTTIQGPKKILKYATTSGTVSYNTTQFYECAPNTDCAGKLTFPQKHLVKLVVEPSVAQSEENELVWTEVVAAAGKHLTNIESYGWYDITHDGNNTWMTFRLSCGITAISINNGTVWNARGYLPSPASSWQGIAHDGNDTWMAINSTGAIAISINDGTSWTLQNNNLSSISDNHWYAIAHGGNNTWMALNNNGPIAINNGTSWTLRGSLSSISNNNYWYAIAHVGNNTWMALNNNGLIAISTNDGMDWTQWSSDLSSISSSIINNNIWRDIAHDGNNTWMAINSTGAIAISANDGANWTLQGNLSSISNSNGWYSITHDGNNIWMAVNTDGKVAVGTSDTTGTIKFTNATPIGVTQNSECELTERREFYIQPTQISDTEGAEDYSIAFDMKNVRLISAEITNRPYSVTSNVLTYDALQLPEMSRVVDFSQKTLANELVYNIGSLQKLNSTNDYISYGADATELSSIDICWNAGISRWELCQNASGYSDKNYLRANTVPGDFFLVTDMETTPNATSYHKILLDSTNSINDYFGIGLNRSFWPSFSHLNTSLEGQCGYRWKTYNIDALPMIFAGLTLPINATLYHGFGSDNEGEGGWYINGGDMDYDATHACQRLTTAACAQLQAAYGANLRIYVVKYRKQTKFKHKITGVADSFNYSYIDACATYSKDVYDADEFTLQDRLQDIANDIKSWAAYAPAKLCDD